MTSMCKADLIICLLESPLKQLLVQDILNLSKVCGYLQHFCYNYFRSNKDIKAPIRHDNTSVLISFHHCIPFFYYLPLTFLLFLLTLSGFIDFIHYNCFTQFIFFTDFTYFKQFYPKYLNKSIIQQSGKSSKTFLIQTTKMLKT